MARFTTIVTVAATLALAACVVAPPPGPSVMVVPKPGKSIAQFQQEDATCRQHASQQIGYASPADAANQSLAGSAALGTILGAAAGALIGAASGDAGEGAAIGAGSGLLLGGATGVGAAQASGAGMQHQYDVTYVQCMYASGNGLPMQGARPYGAYPYGPYGGPMYQGYYSPGPY